MATKTVRACVLGIAWLAVPGVSVAQTNPCNAPLSHQILDVTSKAYAELPEHTAVLPDGRPVVASYQYAVWPEGADPTTAPPVQGPSTIPRTSFVAVAGVPGCYEVTGGLPALMPQQARLIASLRAVSQPGAPTPFSAWSAPSNSFSLASTPRTPAALGRVRIQS